MCITPQNIFICDLQRLDQITDITADLEEPNLIDNTEKENEFSIEEFINIEFTDEAQEITLEEPKTTVDNTKENENIQELLEDLTRPLKLTESHPNLFLALT